MNWYTIILFVHAIAVLVLTAALTLEASLLFQLRRVSRPADSRTATGMAPVIGIVAISSLVIIYGTGAYLTESLHAWQYAWPRFAVLEIVLFAIFGAITGRRMRAIRRYSTSQNADLSVWNAMTRGAFLKTSLSTRIWIVMGTILLTAAKPGLRDSLIIVATFMILGLLFPFISFKRRSVVSTVQDGSR